MPQSLTPGRAICPNCGCANNGMDLLPDLGRRSPSDRSFGISFSPAAALGNRGLSTPREARKIVIKRVAGLPGESVQIQNGDVYIDGQIQRKTLDCQRSMAVMVYDANYSTAVTPGRPVLRRAGKAKMKKAFGIRPMGDSRIQIQAKVLLKALTLAISRRERGPALALTLALSRRARGRKAFTLALFRPLGRRRRKDYRLACLSSLAANAGPGG